MVKIQATSKETSADVARLHLKLDKVTKEAIKIDGKIQIVANSFSNHCWSIH